MTASAGKLKAPVAELIYFDEGSHYMAFTFANGDPGNAYLADGARIMLEGHRRGTTADLQPGTKVLRMRMRGGLVRFLLLRPVSG
jgi:hypothetical protein